MSSTNVHAEAALIAAAELYYHDQLSQQEIAQQLGVSRSTVSRMLQLARDEGIVHIEQSGASLVAGAPVGVAPDRARPPRAWCRAGVRAQRAHVIVAPALEELARLELAPGDALAVSWGSTVAAIGAVAATAAVAASTSSAIAASTNRGRFRRTNRSPYRRADRRGPALLHGPEMPLPRLRRTLLADADVEPPAGALGLVLSALVGIGPPTAESRPAPAHCWPRAATRERRRRCGVALLRHRPANPSVRGREAPPGPVAWPAPERRHGDRVWRRERPRDLRSSAPQALG